MDAIGLRKELERWTAQNCGHDSERRYLGMSQIWRCPADLYDVVLNGQPEVSLRDGQRFYEGYLHERDMVARLQAVGLYEACGELVAPWDERVRGHPDGIIGGDLLEIKSVWTAQFEEVRRSNRALQSHYEQIQLYLLYGDWERAIVIYKNRETGELRPIVVWPHVATQERLEEKARQVLEAVDCGERPECECGRH